MSVDDVAQQDGDGSVTLARKEFGAALIKARQRADNMSQKALGDAIDTPQSTISSWERGWSEPSPSMVFQMEDALNCPPGSLSIILGYVRPYVNEPPPSILVAIQLDTELNAYKKQLLLAVYDTMRLHD